jgi:rRNA maturation protein Rpf1
MTIDQPMMTEENIATQFYVLFNAVQNASMNEIQLGQLLHEHHSPKKDETVIKELEELSSVALPEKFGRLIAILDLQNAFLSLGKYVRSFGDAEQVLDKLQGLMTERLTNCEDQQKATAAVYELVLCSDQYCNKFPRLIS